MLYNGKSTKFLRFEILPPFIEVELFVVVDVSVLQGLLDIDDLVTLDVKLVEHLAVALLEVVGHFEFVLLGGDIGLDLGVGVVDDGQEHVEQHEEDEEDVEDEVGRAEDAVRLFQLVEVEVAEDDSEQREAASEDDDKTRMLIHGYVQKCST